MLVRGKRHSAIAAICVDGVLDVRTTTDSVDEEEFCKFIEELSLLPHLLLFDGSNPRSIVVMDNASIYHTGQAASLIEETGAIPLFLPPYSPDIMPIEECLSKVKAYLRARDAVIQVLNENKMDDIILAAFVSVTPTDWIEQGG